MRPHDRLSDRIAAASAGRYHAPVPHFCSSTRQAGVCLHLTSLPGQFGIGEMGAAAHEFIDVLERMQLKVWQFLPTGPTGFGDSPYQGLSAFAGNELLIDVGELRALGLLEAGESDCLRRLPSERVDFGRLIPLKSRLLELAGRRFIQKAGSDLKAEFDQFLQANERSWLNDYALYRVLKQQHGGQPWPQWSKRYRRRRWLPLRRFQSRWRTEIERVKIIQFLFDRQWSALRAYAGKRNITLFGDMPIYIAMDSADAWAAPDLLQIDRDGRLKAVAGVPPDYFSQDGQLWGNPLYDWRRLAGNGYAWWVKRLARSLQQADLVRIDHFRGLESYWAVPADAATAREGEWRQGPGDKLLDTLKLDLGQLPIVAEDLGMITDGVRQLRDRHGLPGMEVLQFAVLDTDFDPQRIRSNCVCYTGTHDNDTCRGWITSGPDDQRTIEQVAEVRRAALRACGGSADTIHLNMIRLACATPAALAIAPMQDFLGLNSDARLNSPGTSSGNWQWRMQSGQVIPALIDQVARIVEDAGRGAADNPTQSCHNVKPAIASSRDSLG